MAGGSFQHRLEAVDGNGVLGREPIDCVEAPFIGDSGPNVVPTVLHTSREYTKDYQQLVFATQPLPSQLTASLQDVE
jgi:hypothetical protein